MRTPKIKKIVLRTLLIILIIIPIASFAHFIIFPQETRSLLIDFSNFKKEGRIYFDPQTLQNKIDSIQSIIQQASLRVGIFWGGKKSDPKFIYCENVKDFKKYSVSPAAPAVTYLKWGATIVINRDGADLDIIAHEISHVEFYECTGFFKFTFAIPSWFKHGLAMQNDYRNYYSEDTLKIRSDNFRNLPDVKSFKTDQQFYNGTLEQIMLNYMTAKYEVKHWYKREKLEKLIRDLNACKSFDESFVQ